MKTWTKTIDYAPFNKKHEDYIERAVGCYMSVAEGAVRAGKTIDNCLVAAYYLENCKDEIHIASGYSVSNAMTNIGDCNGFGLEHLFRGQCRWGKFNGHDTLYIYGTNHGVKKVIFCGGGKADSYKKIQGNSYGLWIATEIANHYDSDRQDSFIGQVFNRQMAAHDRKVLWDLNPNGPTHDIYKKYIDRYKEISDTIGGYNYQHFTIDDNNSLSEERKDEEKAKWPPDSFMYKRNILGQRVNADGLIYNNWEKREFDIEELRRVPNVSHVYGQDFGYSEKSRCAFIAATVNTNTREIYVFDEIYLPGMTNAALARELKSRGYDRERIMCDSEAPDRIAELQLNGIRRAMSVGGKDVINGIQFIQQFKIIVHPRCQHTLDELASYSWDPNSAKDQPIKAMDHLMDALRYACSPLILKRRR